MTNKMNTAEITNIACPGCYSKNRLPTSRLGDSPKCGKCRTPIFAGKPVELTENNMNSLLNNSDIPVLVDCWAPWCGPCQSFAPIFEQAAKELEPKLRLAKLDTEAEQSLGSRWNIRSIPTLILFQQGKEVARVAGALPLGQLKQWLQQQGVIYNQ